MDNDRRANLGTVKSLLLDAHGKPMPRIYSNLVKSVAPGGLRKGSAEGMKIQADSMVSGMPAFSPYSSGKITTIPSEFYHPLFEPTSLLLPTRAREISSWSRHWYRSDSLVRAAIDMHSEFPMTGFVNVLDDDAEIKEFFDEVAFNVLHLDQLIFDIALEWWKIGNVMFFLHWDESNLIYDDITILNPDYVDVTKSPFSREPHLMLQVDDTLRNIVQTKQPAEVYNQIPHAIKQAVASGRKVSLEPYEIEIQDPNIKKPVRYFVQTGRHMAMKASHYETLGTPIMYSVFKVLFYKDLIRRAQVAIARRHITPIKLVKVGAPEAEPSQDSIDAMKAVLTDIENNPHNFLVSHYAVAIDYVASAGHIMNLQPEYEWIDKELLAGLLMSKAIVYGDGPNYGGQTVGVQILLNRYLRFEKTISNMIREYIYKPIALARGFWRKNEKTGRYKLLYPEIQWEMMRMRDDVAQKNLMSQLLDKGIISRRTFYHTIGVDYDQESKLIKKEKEEHPPMPAAGPGITTPGGITAPGALPPGGMGNLPLNTPAAGGAGKPMEAGGPGTGAVGKPQV